MDGIGGTDVGEENRNIILVGGRGEN